MAKIQIITTDENGGGNACEALWYDMATAAQAEGHQITAFVSHRSKQHDRLKQLASDGAKVITRLSEPNSGRLGPILHKIWHRTGARWTYRMTLSKDADARILNVGTMGEIVREPWASILESSNMPTAIIVHNNPEIRDYTTEVKKRLSAILGSAHRICFVSNRLRENAEQQLLTRLPNASTVKNPVNMSSVEIEPWPSDDTLRMALVGRLDAFVKGQIRLLHALSDPVWRSRDWSLSIYGSGPDEDRIRQAITFYQLEDKVKMEGFAQDIRAEIWSRHHALIMPSMLEGMPLTLVEAMLCGRPALCSDVGGASELIENSRNGFLAESPFFNQLAVGLNNLWNSKENLQVIGEAAHRTAFDYLPANPGRSLLDELAISNLSPPLL